MELIENRNCRSRTDVVVNPLRVRIRKPDASMGEAMTKLAVRCQNRMEEVAAGNLRAVSRTAVGGEIAHLMSRCPEGSRDRRGTRSSSHARPQIIGIPASLSTGKDANLMSTAIDEDEPVGPTRVALRF